MADRCWSVVLQSEHFKYKIEDQRGWELDLPRKANAEVI